MEGSRALGGASVTYHPPADAIQQIDTFLESLAGDDGPGDDRTRLVRLCHALTISCSCTATCLITSGVGGE